MKIEVNTDKVLDGNKKQQEYFSAQIMEDLKRVSSAITRIEVHLKDENGEKEGFNAISCMLEARLEGKQPIAVHHNANTLRDAVKGATDKLKSALESILGRARSK